MRGVAPRAVPFDPGVLGESLARLTTAAGAVPARYLVAWSGGADSTALLAALCELRAGHARFPAVTAVHVDHGLQSASASWVRHCRRLARTWRVPLHVERLQLRRAPGESLEAVARAARYAAFTAQLRGGDVLLLGQHARDQLETMLLQLLRGAGPRGLGAMPHRRRLGQGELWRPLLDCDPGALSGWLRTRGIPWVEDPTNGDTDLDRNYLRGEILPRLQSRWPAALLTAGRSARLMREADARLTAQAARDLRAAADGADLSLAQLRRYSAGRQAAVLRAWLRGQDVPVPDELRLLRIAGLANLREDAKAVVHWAGYEVRRHQDRLLVRRPAIADGSSDRVLHWRWRQQPALELACGRLRILHDAHGDLDLARLPDTLAVRTRPATRRAGRGIDVKSLLREAGVPSWLRDGLPFLHDPRAQHDESGLLAIADLWLAEVLRAGPASRRRGRIVWQGR